MSVSPNLNIFHWLAGKINPYLDVAIKTASVALRIEKEPPPGVYAIYLHSISKDYENIFIQTVKDLSLDFEIINTKKLSEIEPGNNRYLHISFDDGFKDNHKHGLHLSNLSIPSTFFISTGWIDQVTTLSDSFQQYTKNKPQLTWSEVQEMNQAGCEIGAHTINHFRLSQLNTNDCHHELKQSKDRLEEELKKEVTSFSFPYGRSNDFSLDNIKLAQELGYKDLFSTIPKPIHNANPETPFSRFGIEPQLSAQSVKYLLAGLAQKLLKP